MAAEKRRQGMPTLKTLAEMTGFSITAVSRALKDAPDIGEETKKLVRQAAKEIGYRPNRAGFRLRTGKTQVISLILNTDEEFMGLTSIMINGISDRLRNSSYHLVVTPFSPADDRMAPVRYVVETNSADGVILSEIEPDDARVAYLVENKVPFATHGRTEMGIGHPWVDFDNERFAYESVARLADAGARRIGLLGPPPELRYGEHIKQGLARALKDHGLEAFPVEPAYVGDPLETIEQAWIKVFKSGDYPCGIVSAAGAGAFALVAAIESAGLTVGKDVHIASKQSSRVLQRLRSSIIAVDENFREAGYDLADFVLRSIEGEAAENLQKLAYPES